VGIDVQEAGERGASTGARAASVPRGPSKRSLRQAVIDARDQIMGPMLRKAAAAGARVLYDEMQMRARGADGGPHVHTGNLAGSVYYYWNKGASTGTRFTYNIGPNVKQAPHWHLLEYGHWRVNMLIRLPNGQLIATKERLDRPVWTPAKPYIRPTMETKRAAAMDAARQFMRDWIRSGPKGDADGD
jgi:hypothetical protein